MDAAKLINEGYELFKAEKYDEAIQKLNEALESIPDKTQDIQKQVNAQHWLGRCYMEQAIKTSNTKQADEQFAQAIEHYQKGLHLAEQLNEQNGIQEQMFAQSWLGGCYFEQAIKTSDARQAIQMLNQAIEHFQKWLHFAQQMEGQNGIQQQVYVQSAQGLCYFEQAIKASDTRQANQNFDQAIEYFKKCLHFAQQMEGQNGIDQTTFAFYWLGRCFLEKNRKSKTVKKNKNDIQQYFEHAKLQYLQLQDETLKAKHITAIRRYEKELDFLTEDYDSYFNSKKEDIQKHLPLNKNLKEPIASILAVLSIAPVEFDKPLAHYTSPFVCEKLLGIKQKEEKQSEINPSKMRMNSSTYMNDPYEGKSLLDFLDIRENSLENKTDFNLHNAFFACFSTRVNDLNQFRLYGKVNNIEASGCCLVFNKRKDWVKEPNVSASYKYLNYKNSLYSQEEVEVIEQEEVIEEVTTIQSPSEDLPLYQVAYIFYRDEYTEQNKYNVLLKLEEKFGICLKPISDNTKWHEVRQKQFKIALTTLRTHFQKNNKTAKQQQANQSALEYIRYLFKDYAFRDEEEFRLLQIEELGSEKVKYCHETNSAYVEYADICNKLDEVILGTNYKRAGGEQKVEAFRYLLKQKLPHIKVSHSSLPINAALPARKP
ncbi:tetratricopeptide repeat protein [Neisseria animaloris]|nr:tetratricopeptide repeat protein [Neisseria animaloris]